MNNYDFNFKEQNLEDLSVSNDVNDINIIFVTNNNI